MLKPNVFLTCIAILFLGAALHAQEIDVSGDWEFTMTTQRGEMTSNMTIVQDGGKITVTMEGRGGGENTGEGTISGNNIEWTISRSTPRGDMTMTYKGTVAGNTITGELTRGDRTMEWKATKK